MNVVSLAPNCYWVRVSHCCALSFWTGTTGSGKFQPLRAKVLVTLGGADPDNVTAKVIQAVAHLNDLKWKRL